MNLSKLEHFVAISKLSHAGKVEFASRCAALGVRLLTSRSFPVAFTDMAALENVVRLADEAANRCDDPAELKSALRDLGYLAFTSPTPHFQSDVIMSHVAHATYAAGLTALTGSAAQAQDAMDYTIEAARTAGAEDIERSLAEELARVRRTVALPIPLSLAPAAAM